MCMIRLQRHMGAVARMGPGSDAEWDWLPTELGCCCPESESNTHNASVSAQLTDAELGALEDPPGTGTLVPAGVHTPRGRCRRDYGRIPGSKETCAEGLGHRQCLPAGFTRFRKECTQ